MQVKVCLTQWEYLSKADFIGDSLLKQTICKVPLHI
jgi:hypothetical protein